MRHRCILLAAIALSGTASADLPMLEDDSWLGSFLVFEDRGVNFRISSKGNTYFEPRKRDGKPVAGSNPIKVGFRIIETLPNGKSTLRKVDPDAFTSDSPAVLDPREPVTITGSATGGITFEITASEDRGAISLTGRITDKGTTKNPVHLAISMGFKTYKSTNPKTDAQKKDFETKIKRDEIRLEFPDGKRETLDFADSMNPAEKAKDGFSAAEIRTESHGGMRWELAASGKSTIRFEDKGEAPLWKGFTFSWTVNEGADPAVEKFSVKYK